SEVEEHLREGHPGRVEGERLGLPAPGPASGRARALVPAVRLVVRRDLREVGGRRLPDALARGGDRRRGRPEGRLLAERDVDAFLERLPLLRLGQIREDEEGEDEEGDGNGRAPAAARRGLEGDGGGGH